MDWLSNMQCYADMVGVGQEFVGVQGKQHSHHPLPPLLKNTSNYFPPSYCDRCKLYEEVVVCSRSCMDVS